MGLYFRPSVSLGNGLRLNFSKSGVGMSGGVRGFRVGVNPRGQRYVQCGADGIYYRKQFGSATNKNHSVRASPTFNAGVSSGLGPSRIMASGDISRMVDSSAKELLAEIERKHRKRSYHVWILAISALCLLMGMARANWSIIIASFACVVVGVPLLLLNDKRRKTVEIIYHLDPAYELRYRHMIQSFQELGRCQGLWRINSEAAVSEKRRRAGAGRFLDRTSIRLEFKIPPHFQLNVNPVIVPAGSKRLCFLPDTILVFEGSRIGAIGCAQLTIKADVTPFMEGGQPQHDARQIGQRWQFANKNGDPDRRFANNRQVPVMQYGILNLQSASGLTVQFYCSQPQAASNVATAVSAMR